MSHHNLIAALRKTWALSQDELADLLGMTRGNLSRIELADGRTMIDKALMLEALFGVHITTLFPDLYAAAYAVLVPRLALFSVAIESEVGEAADRKRELLADFTKRAPVTDPGA